MAICNVLKVCLDGDSSCYAPANWMQLQLAVQVKVQSLAFTMAERLPDDSGSLTLDHRNHSYLCSSTHMLIINLCLQ